MTIVAFHYTEDGFFAISDGLISRGGSRVLEQVQKIIQFTPEYKIPVVSLGRLNGFRSYAGGDFCICFAGNYSIISTVISDFLEVVGRKLVLCRDGNGTPTVYQRSDEGSGLRGRSYNDDYNFSTEEMIPLTVNFLANILNRIVSSVCNDFSSNSMQMPDVEFILFGEQIAGFKRSNNAQVLTCKEFIDGASVVVRYSVLPWTLSFIGDASVIPTISSEILSSPDFDLVPVEKDHSDYDKWTSLLARRHKVEFSRVSTIKNSVLNLVQVGTSTIGGDCTLVTSGWASGVTLSTIRNSDIDKELS